uniref:Uncharacterized protein n=1 Tax=Prevotella sp. GTC17254 TaxID=3236794 RepID=A0AB33J2J4_9BACT
MDMDHPIAVGKTFGTQNLSINFESNDSISFKTKNTLYILNGKSKYKIKDNIVTIRNSYKAYKQSGANSCILSFTGQLKKDRIEHATFSIIGHDDKEHVFRDNISLLIE